MIVDVVACMSYAPRHRMPYCKQRGFEMRFDDVVGNISIMLIMCAPGAR